MKGAAHRGHSDCLAYAIKGGCPFDDGDDLLNDAAPGDGLSAGQLAAILGLVGRAATNSASGGNQTPNTAF